MIRTVPFDMVYIILCFSGGEKFNVTIFNVNN